MTPSFWTAYQYPLHQAIQVSDNKIVNAIPAHPPGTPARQVWLVDKYGQDLLIGRRACVELWAMDGKQMLKQAYHRWMYQMHVAKRHNDYLLIGSAGLDCLLLVDWDGQLRGEWWAHQDGLSAKLAAMDSPNWQTIQLTAWAPAPGSMHLNSANVEPDKTYLVTLCHSKTIVIVDVENGKSKSFVKTKHALPHDFQIDRRFNAPRMVYGCSEGLVVDEKLIVRAQYVKRVLQYGPDEYVVTCETGVIRCKENGTVIEWMTLPRPWCIVPY